MHRVGSQYGDDLRSVFMILGCPRTAREQYSRELTSNQQGCDALGGDLRGRALVGLADLSLETVRHEHELSPLIVLSSS